MTTFSHSGTVPPFPPGSLYPYSSPASTSPSFFWSPSLMDLTGSFVRLQDMSKDDSGVSVSASNGSGVRLNSASPVSQLVGVNGMASGRNSPEQTSPSGGAESRAPPPTVPAACLACRGKHLKCDGQNPCSRCSSTNSECVYVASRRGYKGPRRGTAQNPNKRHASSSPPDTSTSPRNGICIGSASTAAPHSMAPFSPSTTNLSEAISNSLFNVPPNQNMSQIYRPQANLQGFNNAGLMFGYQNGTVPAQVPVPTVAERCLDAFYYRFHQAHPFVLPKEYLLRIAKEGTLEPLLAAIRWIGSLYMDAGPTRASLFEEAHRLAYEIGRPKDGFLVQALILLTIGLDGSGQQEKAREVLADAERIAVQISLNTRQFATLNGRGMPILEESWRRTWWDFFVVDAMIAGTHRATNFLLFDIPTDVALPCEEHEYLAGTIPQPKYLEDLENSDFSDDDGNFSSFAYRILSARNLGRLMRTPPIFGPEDENLARIEALLTNWRLHLPESKRDALNKDGRLDEMIFQAHMMMLATSLLLHQPHSQLDTSPAREVNSCAPHRPVPCGDAFNAHTKHTIQSANEISRLITHRVPLLSHTHFFSCVISLSSIVHLSKWALYFIPQDDDDLRQQIRLNTGALCKMAQVWKSSEMAATQVKGVAQEIYRIKKQQQMTPQYWLGLTQEEVMNSIAADDSIIGEIETMENLSTIPNLLG